MSELDLHRKVRNAVKKLVQTQMAKSTEGKHAAVSATLKSLLMSATNLEDLRRDWRRIVDVFRWCSAVQSNRVLREDYISYIALIGGHLLVDEDIECFFRYLSAIIAKSRRDDERYFYVEAFAATVRRARRLAAADVATIMDFAKTCLDENDSPEALTSLLDICAGVAQQQPAEFAPHLHDVCDFVIGWYMDRNQPDYVEAKCHEMIVAFRPFFHADISAAVGFLMSLVDDLLFTVQQLVDQEEPKKQYFIHSSIVSILIAFEDIWENSFTADNFSAASELTDKLFIHVEDVMTATERRDGQLASVVALHLALVLSRAVVAVKPTTSSNETVVEAVRRLLIRAYTVPATSKHDVVAVIRISEKIMTIDDIVDREEMLRLLIDYLVSDNCVRHMSAKLSADASALLAKVLNTTELGTIQPNYRLIANKLQSEFQRLATALEDGRDCQSTRQRGLMLQALLSALEPLVIAKNSIIVLHGLNPSLFSLLFHLLPLQEPWLAIFFSEVFHRLVALAKRFAKTHNQFIAHSDMLSTAAGRTSSFLIESPAAKHFEHILAAVGRLLNTVDDAGMLALIDWLDALMRAISVDLARSLPLAATDGRRCAAVKTLQRSLLTVLVEQRLTKKSSGYQTLLTAIFRFGAFAALEDAEFSKTIAARIMEKADSGKREQFLNVINHLPASFLMSESFAVCVDSSHLYGQRPLGKPYMGVRYFQLLTNFLVNGRLFFHHNEFGVYEQEKSRLSRDVVDRLCFALTGNQCFHFSTGRKMAMIAQHYALFCVENRLRTPIGKAADTFSKFDGVINQLAAETANESMTYDNDDDEFPHKIQRIVFALDMLDTFDKLMNFANRGSVLAVAILSASARQFFHTNEPTWQAWLLRVTPPAMSLCFAAGRYAQIVRLAAGLFADAERRHVINKDIRLDTGTLSAICWLVRAYVELAAPLAVRGVRQWAKRIFGVDMDWIQHAEKLAASNYESSLIGFCTILNVVQPPHNCVDQAIRAMCVKAMKACRNVAFTRPFHEILLRSLPDQTEDDRQAAKHLKLQLDSINSLSSWTELENASRVFCSSSTLYDLSASVDQTEATLAHAFVSATELQRANTNFIASLEENIAQLCMVTMTEARDDASALVARATILRQSVGVLRAVEKRALSVLPSGGVTAEKSTAINYANVISLWNDSTPTDVAVRKMLCDWLERVHAASCVNGGYYDASFTALRSTLNTAHAETAHIAAKSGNDALSHYHLRKYSQTLTAGGYSQRANGVGMMGILPALGSTGSSFMTRPDVNLLTFLRTVKITWNLDNNSHSTVRTDCFRNMLNVVSTHGTAGGTAVDTRRRVLLGKMCVCLSRWSGELPNALHVLYQVHSSTPNVILQNILQLAEHLESDFASGNPSEALCGAFLMVTSGNAALAAADVHYALADWAVNQLYQSDMNVVEPYSLSDVSEITRPFRLPVNDSSFLCRLGLNVSSELSRRFLYQLASCKTSNEFKRFVQNSDELSNLLSALPFSDIDQLWAVVKHRQLRQFQIALTSSVNFLVAIDHTDEKNALKVVTAALRLLDFLSTQPEWFKEVIGSNWPTTISVAAWKNLIPQLFARFCHVDAFVRQTALKILAYVGELRPHVVCYPAIVGAELLTTDKPLETVDESTSGSAKEKEVEEELLVIAGLSASRHNTALQKQLRRRESCQWLVDTLRAHSPQLVDDVTRFCIEMRKICMLSEERWLFALQRIDGELTRQAAEAETDFVRQFSYVHLNDEQRTAGVHQRHEAIAGPIYEKLQQLFEVTCAEPKTDNDAKFCKMFRPLLEQAFEHFNVNRHNINVAFTPFRNILNMITTRAMKRSALALQTADISPYLAGLVEGSSAVPVPGQSFGSTTVITLRGTQTDVLILPTKTRPKKLTFIGSNGKTYAFLFKGHEDLRIDERVMQLSLICNTLLRSKAHKLLPAAQRDRTSDGDEFLLSLYSVTPLGRECGLIEWVDGATPLFHLYRKWKLRDAEDQETRRQQTELKSKTAPPDSPTVARKIMTRVERSAGGVGRKSPPGGGDAAKPRDLARPTEQFFAKLKDVFVEEGIAVDALKSRHGWPTACLEKVFQALVKETPQDILAKELWMHAGSASMWWRVTRRFTRSTATASMAGWTVLGLGDRHLDNLLVDVRTGRVVHVDYNVSFEKGKTLRVPETVPFRLTGNIVSALGPTGVEGLFRESSIQLLSLLRSSREIILTTLQMSDATVDQTGREEKEKTPTNDEAGDMDQVESTPSIADKVPATDVDVVRAVHFKLNGREKIDNLAADGLLVDGYTAIMTPEQQVDFLIDKATNSTNLALLYEGWTAWV